MGRPKRKQPPRVHAGPGGMSLTIRVRDEANEDQELQHVDRAYEVDGIKISVRRQPSVHDFNEIAAAYTYAGRAVPDVWPAWDGTKKSNDVTEMVVVVRALAFLGYEKAKLSPRTPPNPDLFVESPSTGPIAIEVTLAMDEGEQQFQRAREDFVRFLNEQTESRKHYPFQVSLGFVSVPGPKDKDRVAQAIFEDVERKTAPLTYEPEGLLASYLAQIQLIPKANAPIFSGGGVVNVRGHADLYEIAMQRVAEKRDLMDYDCDGRDLWLVVGIQLPLIGPDVMGAIYDTNLKLGQFSKVVFSQQGDMVTFTRSLKT